MHNIDIVIPSGTLKLQVENTILPLEDICGFACRQNPKRGFLFVSKVLGKHYPVKPSKMTEVYHILSQQIEQVLEDNDTPLFLGFAETATGFGSGIYSQWKNTHQNKKSHFIHTTRYHFDKKKILLHFQEEHSHATGHIVYQPENHDFILQHYDTLILMDDEITTGKTMTNFMESFTSLQNSNIKKVIVLTIKNWMVSDNVHRFYALFPHLKIEFVQILKGTYDFVKDPLFICEPMPNVIGNDTCKEEKIYKNDGRFGIEYFSQYDFSFIHDDIDLTKKTLILGTGEFTYYPYLLAQYLEQKGVDVYYQSTTRSPILKGGDIKEKIQFEDNYGDNIPNFVYNVEPNQYEQVFICYETQTPDNCYLDQTLHAKNIFFNQRMKIHSKDK